MTNEAFQRTIANMTAPERADRLERELNRRAAGPWQTGKPTDYGRYLIEYQQGNVKRVFIGDYDPVEERWYSFSDDADVLRWAEIHSDYA